MAKKVLLIQPSSGFEIKHANLFMPMGLICVAGPLLAKGIEVVILDQRVEKAFFKRLDEVLSQDPVCVGITSMTGFQILSALEIADHIRKRSGIPLVWGGVHPTLTSDQTIRDERVDVVVRGEGEITFAELVEALERKQPLNGIKGISYKDGIEVRHNPDREFCDLDALPRAPYHLVDAEKYIVPEVPGSTRCLSVYASRGCPRQCLFCYNPTFNKSRYRKRNIDKVIAEIEWLVKEYDLDSIVINDDNFSVDIERTHYFCRQMIEKNIVPRWKCSGMEAWCLEKMDLDLLERSGCKRILIGVESGSDKRLRLLKRRDTRAQIEEMVRKFAKTAIIPHYDLIIGYPDEDEQELAETIELVNYIRRTDPKAYVSSLHICTLFPGTALTEIAQKDYGFLPPEKLEDWAKFRLESINVPWIPEHKKRHYLNLCWMTYFTDDRFVERTRSNRLIRAGKNFLVNRARKYWQERKFDNCPEFQALDWFANEKIRRKSAQIRKRGLIRK